MRPLTFLASVCAQIDRVFGVSLSYGATFGDKPHWTLAVLIPAKGVRLVRVVDDIGNIRAVAQDISNELQQLTHLTLAVRRGEEKLSLDTYQA